MTNVNGSRGFNPYSSDFTTGRSPSQGGPDHQACNRQDTCFPQDHAYDVHALCADGHAGCDLLGALDEHVGDHSVTTRSGRQRGENLKKPESEAINSSLYVPCWTLGCETLHRFSPLRPL